ncbi:bifunctional diaminohydroxyphosphoribosylaminopyrimidine deaminase/5-amino-6-(5-phosphoribosylamino)uracil reductase RibD [Flavobacterium psychrophilum]|uniref:bifunctional diaminohydroxyphosphoribosylaminopyrimidine deaminase/5-amino-6-(5-phosphoribosylamino)uracil reductase RibD n=1 Tax=Flavobacterium psychrophilum TaxID=96345 RepID=UPI001D091678|nr:bifunctional diaminohydroxyphosphoribosylaminopyrimidine deaminase/5-amino-6-(5-phosphoribosylamino)uracil reductase RibD [Flavobacterium psychrophilum]MCB6087183.1 bifunctional diaminohydroxyphosphoribosylaminopyrimidine deaminase/5-amino-6-(5-phosphoribosylamino)uracil reductase RibD [Flavobacterium psychrophilum]
MKIHEKYIKRCIELAKNGLPAAMPNPSVGAVIVFENKIIGEGYTAAYGGNHAEVNAILSVKNKDLLAKSTIYVSLEPCSHFGKTPPCCDLIIKYKIPNVVIGTVDSNSKVSGQGIKKLIEAGANVIVDILEAECRESNKRFFTFHEKKRPYIILKWAETKDQFIAPLLKNEQKPVWITNIYSRQLAHKWRTEEQAILVGTQTAIDDNPRLDVRDWTGKNPTRIVLDKNNRIPKENHIFDIRQKTFVISDKTINYSENVALQIVLFLFDNNLQSVIIEGGRQTLQTFIDANLWDEARIFVGQELFSSGTKAPVITSKRVKRSKIDNDELLIYLNHD